MGFTNFFEQFQRYKVPKVKDNHHHHNTRFRDMEAVNTFLNSFGNDVCDCSENFAKQDIEYKDLASLTHKDLELLGVREKTKQDEMLEVFRDLTRQDYFYNEVISNPQAKQINSKIISNTNTQLNTMKLSLSEANLKLKLLPSGEVVIDERHFASKFVLDTLDELKKISENIDKRLLYLEMIAEKKRAKRSDSRFKAVITVTSIILFISVCLWRKNQ